mmetsp:Transcript_3260/g.9027  ORF Transcript_3260/g.9027 Transcript_3260/m.9027 type:complete len:238 (-) Transcript_3260:1058-1771(-)
MGTACRRVAFYGSPSDTRHDCYLVVIIGGIQIRHGKFLQSVVSIAPNAVGNAGSRRHRYHLVVVGTRWNRCVPRAGLVEQRLAGSGVRKRPADSIWIQRKLDPDVNIDHGGVLSRGRCNAGVAIAPKIGGWLLRHGANARSKPDDFVADLGIHTRKVRQCTAKSPRHYCNLNVFVGGTALEDCRSTTISGARIFSRSAQIVQAEHVVCDLSLVPDLIVQIPRKRILGLFAGLVRDRV